MTNPLQKHFRHSTISIKLPSKNKYWNEADIDMPVMNELPIYPMTMEDEIGLRTPDSLLNGSTITNLISSCVPNIKNPWNIPMTDMDSILIGIRLASYGNEMDMTINCPNQECLKESEFCLDLRTVLTLIKTANFDKEIEIDGLKFRFRPQTYQQSNKEDMLKFEEQRMVKAVSDSSLTDLQKKEHFEASFKIMRNLIVENIVDHIASIETPENERINDKEFLMEYFLNCSRDVYNKIKTHITELNDSSKLKPLKVKCNHCSHEFESNLIFDYSRFFE